MADTEALQAKLFAEMKGRIKEDDAGVPAPDGPFAYYTRFVIGGQHPLFCRKPRDGGDEQILLDGNALAEAPCLFPHRRRHPQPRPPPGRLCRRYQGLGVLHRQRHRGRHRRARRFPHRRQQRLAGMGRRQPAPCFYVWLDDEHRPRRVLRHTVGAETADALDPRASRPGLFPRPRRDPGPALPPAQRARP